MTNFRYHQTAADWYDHLQELGYSEHVIVATDNATVDSLKENEIRRMVDVWPIQQNGRGGDHNKMFFAGRWRYVLNQLQSGVSILLTDVDNVYMRYVSPQNFVGWDVIHAYSTPWPPETFKKSGYAVCGGMMWLQATEQTIKFVELIIAKCGLSCDDQIVVNKLLADELQVEWDEPLKLLRSNHSKGVFQGLPYAERTGKSKVTSHTPSRSGQLTLPTEDRCIPISVLDQIIGLRCPKTTAEM